MWKNRYHYGNFLLNLLSQIQMQLKFTWRTKTWGNLLAHSINSPFPNGAPPEMITFSDEIWNSLITFCLVKESITGGTAHKCVTLYVSMFFKTPWKLNFPIDTMVFPSCNWEYSITPNAYIWNIGKKHKCT